MEEEIGNPCEINSVDVKKLLPSSIFYLNKKRKFQAEQWGMPLPKHQCWDRNLRECDFRSNENQRVEEKLARDDELELESANDSNSISGETDSVMSASHDAKIQSDHPKAYPSDKPSTSSVHNWGNNYFKNNLYSLDSRSVTKSGADRVQSHHIHNDFGLHTCLNFDDHPEEFGMDYNLLEHGEGSIEQCTDEELEDMLYSNEKPPNNYVLSSGRWIVNQETQPSTKKLTIDKEFEQYFSMLML